MEIIINNLSKEFKDGYNKHRGILNRFISLIIDGKKQKGLLALKNINLEINQGEKIGLIGKNGSGKSTLLRIIARMYQKDSGKIKINNPPIYIGNLHGLMKLRLTMKDNINLLCTLLGLNKKEIKEKLPSIIKFSELEEYIDTQLYKFSSGMTIRLLFSTFIHSLDTSKNSILLLDELLSNALDKEFKIKSMEKIKEVMKSEATIILISHNMNLIKDFCNKTIWMENGEIKDYGPTTKIIKKYLNN
jgi:ABC-type polysaccharide/polyol phosphate transport system ATPase subunit